MAAELTPFPDDHHRAFLEWTAPSGQRFVWNTQAEYERDLFASHWTQERAEARLSSLWIVLLVGGVSAPTWFAVGWLSHAGVNVVAVVWGWLGWLVGGA